MKSIRNSMMAGAVGLFLMGAVPAMASIPSAMSNFSPQEQAAMVADEDTLHGQVQCTDYVYSLLASKKEPIPRGMGNGFQWDDTARRRGYTVSSTPKDNSIGVMERWNSKEGNWGHVFYVNDSAKKGSYYKLDIRHANYGKNPKDAKYYKGSGTWKETKAKYAGLLSIGGGKKLPVGGFITKWPGRR